jgi:hypothetical protein
MGEKYKNRYEQGNLQGNQAIVFRLYFLDQFVFLQKFFQGKIPSVQQVVDRAAKTNTQRSYEHQIDNHQERFCTTFHPRT